MATAGGTGGGQRQMVHTGAGVARREAYHARRADERIVLHEVDLEGVLRAERAMRVSLVSFPVSASE